MSEAGETAAASAFKARPLGFARRLCGGLALIGLAVSLAGCGNCNGWTSPWYKATSPGSCHAEPGSSGGTILLPSE